MPDIDEQLAEPMQSVNWNSVSGAEMTAFGLQLSLLKDADQASEKATSAFWARASAAVSLVVVTTVLLVLGCSPTAVLIGVAVSQLAGVGAAKWRQHVSQRDTQEAQQHVLQELSKLALAHPVR